jgi:hypothetical protein
MKSNLSLIILFFLFSSCCFKSKEQKNWEKYAEKEITKWIGKEMYLPDSILSGNINSIDTFYVYRKNKKIVTYIDVGCSACLINFSFWNKFIEEAQNKKIDCDYLVYINTGRESLAAIAKLGFHHPVLLDTCRLFIKKNSIHDKRFQTALLNEKNEVLLIGDPSVNEKLRELYMIALKRYDD